MNIACILLAAGTGERFGSNKLLTDLAGKPMIEYILSNLPQDTFSECIAVASDASVQTHIEHRGIRTVFNSKPEESISRSIRLGTNELQNADACMYVVADQPLLTEETISAMLDAYLPGSILSLAHRGKRGNPVIFPKTLFGELASLRIGEFGTVVIHAHVDLLKLYETNNALELTDVDTKKNLEIISMHLQKAER